jgi:hypothetical protein
VELAGSGAVGGPPSFVVTCVPPADRLRPYWPPGGTPDACA